MSPGSEGVVPLSLLTPSGRKAVGHHFLSCDLLSLGTAPYPELPGFFPSLLLGV